jgi:UDP-N-acetylmuramyl tripeptide synthase
MPAGEPPLTYALASPQMAEENIAAVIVPDAAAVLGHLAATFYEEPSAALTCIGVVGARGARGVAFLTRAIMEATGQVAGLLTPLGYEVGGSLLSARGELWEPEEEDPTRGRSCTTPGWLAPYRGKYTPPAAPPHALQLQQLLAGVVDSGAETAVAEVAIASLAAGHLADARFDVAVFTGLGTPPPDGSAPEGFPDWAAYRAAAARLFASLSDPTRQRAIINADDPEADAMVAAAVGAKVLTYSGETQPAEGRPPADVYPLSLDLSIWDTALTLATPLGELTLRSALVGRQAVGDIAAAVAVGVALGVPLDLITTGVEALAGVPGQLESVDEGQPFAVIVDEARTPAAVERTLRAVRECGAQHVIAVLGCPGDGDKALRPVMGRTAHQLADVLIVRAPGLRGGLRLHSFIHAPAPR